MSGGGRLGGKKVMRLGYRMSAAGTHASLERPLAHVH